jgi:hypothetical protein
MATLVLVLWENNGNFGIGMVENNGNFGIGMVLFYSKNV